jgi:hypothetical protein
VIQEALKLRMREPDTTQQMTLKRRVGYGDYIDADAEEAEGSEQMQVDKRQKTD